MEFVETTLFTKQLKALFNDDAYREIQAYLIKNPNAGAIIQGGGGIRKLRWSLGEHGKSGGVRLIYYWDVSDEVFFMLFIYPKNKAQNLSKAQLKILRDVVHDEFKE
jgi:hypothetical protein